MKFRTEIEITTPKSRISYKDVILSVGSCFAENIYSKLHELFFNIKCNPFGTLYNSASVLKMFRLAESGKELTKDDLIFYDGEWHSFYHNSEFSDENPEVCLSKINSSIFELNKLLSDLDTVIITFGTSYVYEHIERKMIVSNCHKIPQKYFRRKFLSVEENAFYINRIIEIVEKFNPEAKIILTVSPVRHVKDGLHNNQLSKASLLLALEKVLGENEKAMYFPSYEILNDDLRDYRFYAADLTHPNEVAINYIYEKFSQNFFDRETFEFTRKAENLAKALKHRAINPESRKYKEFLAFTSRLLEKMKKEFPEVNFSEAENILERKIGEVKTK